MVCLPDDAGHGRSRWRRCLDTMQGPASPPVTCSACSGLHGVVAINASKSVVTTCRPSLHADRLNSPPSEPLGPWWQVHCQGRPSVPSLRLLRALLTVPRGEYTQDSALHVSRRARHYIGATCSGNPGTVGGFAVGRSIPGSRRVSSFAGLSREVCGM